MINRLQLIAAGVKKRSNFSAFSFGIEGTIPVTQQFALSITAEAVYPPRRI